MIEQHKTPELSEPIRNTGQGATTQLLNGQGVSVQELDGHTHGHSNSYTSHSKHRPTIDDRFSSIAAKMYAAGVPAAMVKTFRHYYAQLLAGETGIIPSSQALPVETLPTMDQLQHYQENGFHALNRAVVITLNGGLGTTMGLETPKSLIPVKDGHTFLDIIVQQVLHLRRKHEVALPLLFMNSFNTERATAEALAAHPTLKQPMPFGFCQHKVPKLRQDDLRAVEWSADPKKEWCPPGHGNLYLALYTSGLLKELLARGYEYAFVSNVDNLGATLDLALLGYVAAEAIPFLMEVATRTTADRKGGHLAQDREHHLLLREIAQCPPEEIALFQDTDRYNYFNTNNLWLNLRALDKLLRQREGILELPLIRNAKSVDPTEPESLPVYQLETAMGQAIGLFPNAAAVVVPRSRFLPVKDTGDLLALRSDLYQLAEDFTVQRNPARTVADGIDIQLDKEYYRTVAQLEAHFPNGVPSLVNCRRLQIEGEVFFV